MSDSSTNNQIVRVKRAIYLRNPWLIWFISILFAQFQFFLALSSGIIVNQLMESFRISALGAGVLSSAYYYAYVALQTPAGAMLDRFGSRKLLSAGSLICSIGCFIFARTEHVYLAGFGRMLMGGGSAFAFIGSVYLTRQWFHPKKFSTIVGLAEMLGLLGTVIGMIFIASFIKEYGWRYTMTVASIVSFIISILCYLFIRERKLRKKSSYKPSFRLSLQVLLRSKTAWINGIYSGFMFSSITVYAALWAIPFLMKAYHLSITVATTVTTIIFIGAAVGAPVYGFLSSYYVPRQLLMSVSGFLTAAVMLCIIFLTKMPLAVLILVHFLIGLLCASYILTFTVASEIVPRNMSTTSTGFTNTLCMLMAPILQPVIGKISLTMLAHYQYSNASRYEVIDHQIALLILPVIMIVSGFLAWYIPVKTKPRVVVTLGS